MADGGYDVSEILRAERYLLQTLDFDLSYPNPLHYLRRASKGDGYDVNARTLSKYLIEISLVEHRLLSFPPSMLAAAAMWLARLCLDRGPWHANMVHYSGYAQHELLPCAQIMLDYVIDDYAHRRHHAPQHASFWKKYSSKKQIKMSLFFPDWAVHRWPESMNADAPNKGRELEVEFPGVVQAPLPPPPSPSPPPSQ
jgi:G2/mitotic-specific cyclin 1/2